MRLDLLADQVSAYLNALPQVQGCRLYGSLKSGAFDKYSDIDLEVDVSGLDNGRFALQIPALLSQRFPVAFFDFAPSLAPEKYIVSAAVDPENPFGIIDLSCAANPHCRTVSREELSRQNDPYSHILKLFVINLKHFIRGADCRRDMERMYRKVFPASVPALSQTEMLLEVYRWLRENAGEKQEAYVRALEPYVKEAAPFDH